ncbi:MAG: hypothetical protein MZV63_62980 [Marinilabiliales bacterium]|nr:hypothetical protein [Marinilabiliales bacterium]
MPAIRPADGGLAGRPERALERRPVGTVGTSGLLRARRPARPSGPARGRRREAPLARRDGSDDRLQACQACPQLWKGAYGSLDPRRRAGGRAPSRRSSGPPRGLPVLPQKVRGLARQAGRLSLTGTGAAVLEPVRGRLLGPWYPHVRVQWSDTGTGTEFSWMAGVAPLPRGHELSLGDGRPRTGPSRRFRREIMAGPVWFVEAGFDDLRVRDIKLRGLGRSSRGDRADLSSTTWPSSRATGSVCASAFVAALTERRPARR